MKRHWKPILLVLLSGVASAATLEVLVGTSPTRIPRTASTNAVLIQNMGPDAICCAQGVDAGYPNCIVIPNGGGSLSLDVPSNQPVTCVAPNAQVVDAGTRVLEVY